MEQALAVPFELQSLAKAVRYQHWLKDAAFPYLGRRILELGAGIGNLSQHLPVRERLILSDVDSALLRVARQKIPATERLSYFDVDLAVPLSRALAHENLDTVVSFNVMEHVPDDSALLADMIRLLRESKAPGPKRIVSVVPAHQWAFGEIDRKFGHCRRYSHGSFRAALARAGAPRLDARHFYSRYLNLPGLLGWWWNGRVKGLRDIGDEKLELFEKLCPWIRPVDDFLHLYCKLPIGNSLLTVYWVEHE